MATFLFDRIIFGPVQSRRLGNSLGINLLPTDKKVCNFDCIYCECGWTTHANLGEKSKLPSRAEVKQKLQETLMSFKGSGKPIDTITFAGNGEPTMHPEFAEIINDTLFLRNEIFPEANIAVLSNATLIHKSTVFNALQKIEQNILKLDSAFENTIHLLNNPPGNYSLENIVYGLKKFNGNFILQTLFVRGEFKGRSVDNTTDMEIAAWLEVIKETQPKSVMIYTIKRDAPVDTLQAIKFDDLQKIAEKVKKLGIETQISD